MGAQHSIEFAIGLAREFKRPSYLSLMSELSCSEFDNWFLHFKKKPFSYDLNEYGIGQICSSIYNSSGNFKNRIDPKIFYPNYRPTYKTPEQQIAIWKSI